MARSAARPRAVAVDEVAYRWSEYDTPLWARPNSSAQRWNRTREAPTQYLSLTPEGAWAELIRTEDLTSVVAVRLVSMPLWALQVRETRVADYATFEKAEAAGFPPEALVDEDHERCRAEGTRLRARGFRGVLAPSAALPGAVNLTLFGARLAVEWNCDEDRRLAAFVPARQLAVGHPPDDLFALVRQRTAPHAGLADYRRRRRS
ncbi:MAG TPA: RES family NAD+ phosphorylase [Conexibacter sp.]|nr:RES family NAD+ phosphorylase [Conexibacter sp.]